MDYRDLINRRYSCRKFSHRAVDPELIKQIVKAASVAPTAINTQPFKLWIMESAEAKENIRSLTEYSFGADHFIVLGARLGSSWIRPYDGRDFADIDAAIAGTHLMLALYDLGLATTWVAYFNAPKLKQLYPQMKGYDLIGLFPFGYASEEAAPSASHKKRKEINQIAETL